MFTDIDRLVDRGMKRIIRLPLKVVTLPLNLKYYWKKFRQGGLYHMLFERATPEVLQYHFVNQSENLFAKVAKGITKDGN